MRRLFASDLLHLHVSSVRQPGPTHRPSGLDIVLEHILPDAVGIAVARWFAAKKLAVLTQPRPPVREPVDRILGLRH